MTVVEAATCIPCAGGYVVGVENGVMRSLTAQEESEFQGTVPSHSTENPAVETTPAASTGAAASDSGYAVMIRVRVGDYWTWTTWMRFETYAGAVAHAREGNKVVRFRSPEWATLRQRSEPASPIAINVPQEGLPPRGEGETLLEFVFRLLSAYGVAQHPEPISDVKHRLIKTEIIDIVLSRLSESETKEFERIYAEDKQSLMEALGNRFCTVLKPESGCP
jgi:hypothetical protein